MIHGFSTKIIQAAKRDEEAIKLCDEHEVAMIFTRVRHFLH
ncbi:MAG: hypothetical protein ACYCXU_03655 [Thermoleophilia bacterium]